MADRDEWDDYTNTKRVRLSSDASLSQNISYSDDKDNIEPEIDFSWQLKATGEGENSKKPSTSREHHVGNGVQERRQSDDFPTCFSVEDSVDDIDEHHYRPVAGNCNSFSLKYPRNITSIRFRIRHFVFVRHFQMVAFEFYFLHQNLFFFKKLCSL